MTFSPMKIKADWGEFDIKTTLEFYRQCRAQLQYFLDNKQSPDEKFTRLEIQGYDELLSTNSEETALAFLHAKGCMKVSNCRVTNLEIINTLKGEGKWLLKSQKL